MIIVKTVCLHFDLFYIIVTVITRTGTPMKKLIFPLLCFLLILSDVSHAATPFSSSINAGFIYDDNVTRAERNSDIESDSFLQLAASTATRIPLTEISYISLKGSLDFNRYRDFSKLSNTRLGVQGGYHIKPSSGYTAIEYLLLLGYERRFFSSDLRDGYATNIRLGIKKRLTDIMSMRLGYHRQAISADHEVFDADNQRVYLDLDFRLFDKHTFYTTLTYTDGDIVSTTVPWSGIIDASKGRIVRDDAFLDLTPPRFAYRLDARTAALKIGDSYAITSAQSLEGAVFYYNVQADGNNDYTGLIYSLKYFYRF